VRVGGGSRGVTPGGQVVGEFLEVTIDRRAVGFRRLPITGESERREDAGEAETGDGRGCSGDHRLKKCFGGCFDGEASR